MADLCTAPGCGHLVSDHGPRGCARTVATGRPCVCFQPAGPAHDDALAFLVRETLGLTPSGIGALAQLRERPDSSLALFMLPVRGKSVPCAACALGGGGPVQ